MRCCSNDVCTTFAKWTEQAKYEPALIGFINSVACELEHRQVYMRNE